MRYRKENHQACHDGSDCAQDTIACSAAISACEKAARWEVALQSLGSSVLQAVARFCFEHDGFICSSSCWILPDFAGS